MSLLGGAQRAHLWQSVCELEGLVIIHVEESLSNEPFQQETSKTHEGRQIEAEFRTSEKMLDEKAETDQRTLAEKVAQLEDE